MPAPQIPTAIRIKTMSEFHSSLKRRQVSHVFQIINYNLEKMFELQFCYVNDKIMAVLINHEKSRRGDFIL